MRLDNISGEAAAIGYDPVASYAQSKLALVMHARNLDCRLRASRKAGETSIGVVWDLMYEGSWGLTFWSLGMRFRNL